MTPHEQAVVDLLKRDLFELREQVTLLADEWGVRVILGQNSDLREQVRVLREALEPLLELAENRDGSGYSPWREAIAAGHAALRTEEPAAEPKP